MGVSGGIKDEEKEREREKDGYFPPSLRFRRLFHIFVIYFFFIVDTRHESMMFNAYAKQIWAIYSRRLILGKDTCAVNSV